MGIQKRRYKHHRQPREPIMKENFDLEIREREYFKKGIYRILDKLHRDSARFILTRSRQHVSIHNFRKNIKKIRGIIRLLRHEIGNDKYHELNNFYRNIGQEVAVVRNDTSQIELLQSLKGKVKDEIVNKALTTATNQLRKKRNIEFGRFENKGLANNLNQMILTVQQTTHELDFTGDPDSFILKSLRHVHQRARSAYETTGFCKQDEIYHYWRKQVKYLMYHLMVLNKPLPSSINVYINELNKLGNLLGKLHDLNLFNELIKGQNLIFVEGEHKKQLLKFIYAQRAALKKRVEKIGGDVFSESSASFAIRVYDLWINSVCYSKGGKASPSGAKKHLPDDEFSSAAARKITSLKTQS